MLKDQKVDQSEKEKDNVENEGTNDETEKDDEFEYDDDGNIIIPDVIEDEDQDEDGDEDAADTDDDTDDDDEGDNGDDDKDKEPKEPEAKPEGKDEKDAQIEALQKKLEEQAKEYEALKAQSADTLAKLGVKSDNVLEGLEKVAAESDDMSLDDYRKKKAEIQREDAARKLYQQTEFEKKMQSDFAEIQREFPETRGLKSLREIENLARFGRFRDLGLSPKEAYAAADALIASQQAPKMTGSLSQKRNSKSGEIFFRI